ncbi:putative modification methylase (cytosine-specific methyltransferase) [Neisseria zoodegmatis]|uniref:site-specific DNA-methyltransferase (adenine-specific) n=3 Tax=Neisseria zoodegmatis TaxID=326523 RepID=A0AB38DRC0_9NEIS|nr:Eco57I restriction-modification methylase domain-containing protein [Neisseria zoodegmatis]SNU79814.1 putative modification methylase (cytosine-specific methyltransferase) [Neisseria zoodegmatis]
MITHKEALEIIEFNQLHKLCNLREYIRKNKVDFSFSDLSLIIELSNSKRKENSAYYTNDFIVKEIMNYLPSFDGFDEIDIIEPSVGAGNFLPYLFEKYKNIKTVNLTVIDIDSNVLKLLKELYADCTPNNFNIVFLLGDFMTMEFSRVNLVIGNPPFSKISVSNIEFFPDGYSKKNKNLAGFFLEKSLRISDFVSLVMPKNILNTPEYSETRERIKNRLEVIIDFGEKGFKGVLIETVSLLISNNESNKVRIISFPKLIDIVQDKKYIFDMNLPYWVIYRNEKFDLVYSQMKFDVFDVFRDRQLTNANTKLYKADMFDIRVLKSRNITDDGNIIDLDGYDAFINEKKLCAYKVSNYLNSENVYLTPNMTYNPRVMKKPKGCIVNGSVAVLIPKFQFTLNKTQMDFFSTSEYREFYRVARNYQTRSLNIDTSSCYWFGIYKDKK